MSNFTESLRDWMAEERKNRRQARAELLEDEARRRVRLADHTGTVRITVDSVPQPDCLHTADEMIRRLDAQRKLWREAHAKDRNFISSE